MSSERRLIALVALAALLSVSLGGTCWRSGGSNFFFRAPQSAQLSLPGAVPVNLRVPSAADLGTLQLFIDGSPVALDAQASIPDGVTGTVTLPAAGIFTVSAEIDDPNSAGTLTDARSVQIVDLLNPDQCEILNDEECLLPWPSSRFLVSTAPAAPANDLLLAIPQVGMPVLTGALLDPAPLNALDGFSPVVQILMHFPAGVDVAASGASRLLAPGCCGQLDMTPYQDVRTYDTRSLDADSPSVLIDADTGERILHFLEPDGRAAGNPQRQALVMRPAVSLVPGHRYIVAMRQLVDLVGGDVEPEPVFRALRDGKTTTIAAVEARRAAANEIFSTLMSFGIGRLDLVLAFDFVVRSQHGLTHQILSMRDEVLNAIEADPVAFEAQVDLASHSTFNANNLFDCSVPGTKIWRRVKLTLDVPLYLTAPVSVSTLGVLNLDASGTPVQNPTTPFTPALFDFLIPCSVFNPAVTARPLLLGHGLFGTGAGMVDGLAAGLVDEFADDAFPYIAGATDWQGLSSPDVIWIGVGIIGLATQQLNNFPAFTGRLKQGMLNTLVLDHLMKTGFFNAFDEFRTVPGDPDTGVFPGASEPEFYVGISLGGIMGTWLAALSPHIQRFNVDVPGINFGLLLQRSTQFTDFENQLSVIGLTDPMETILGLGLLHEQWVTSEPASMARHVTGLVDTPLPDHHGAPTAGKNLLMTVAWTDHQVSNQVSEIAARTLGIQQLVGSLQQGLAQISDVPEGPTGLDNAMIIYDVGSFDVFDPAYDPFIPPLSNQIVSPDLCDPHGRRFTIPASLAQLFEFLQPGGRIKNFCTDDGVCNASENFERPDGVAAASLCDPLP
ncbi:MAG: hypothetical protein IH884_07820 [Myxococcales bacterium]|nr:hypothetical protein [Myxococcales bacterium]